MKKVFIFLKACDVLKKGDLKLNLSAYFSLTADDYFFSSRDQ